MFMISVILVHWNKSFAERSMIHSALLSVIIIDMVIVNIYWGFLCICDYSINKFTESL